MKKKVKQAKQYRNNMGEIFEFISEGVQQSENSYGAHINTYPCTILKNVRTGELVSVLSNRLDMCFAPQYTCINTKKKAQDFISFLDGSDLKTILSKENFVKLDAVSEFLADQYIKKWHEHVEPHKDFVNEVKNVVMEVLIAVSAVKEESAKKKEN